MKPNTKEIDEVERMLLAGTSENSFFFADHDSVKAMNDEQIDAYIAGASLDEINALDSSQDDAPVLPLHAR